jgi:hypothetical protein
MVRAMNDLAYLIATVVNMLTAAGGIFALLWVFRNDPIREVVDTRVVGILVLVVWVRFFIGLGTARPESSAATFGGLVILTYYLLRPPRRQHLMSWLPQRPKGNHRAYRGRAPRNPSQPAPPVRPGG